MRQVLLLGVLGVVCAAVVVVGQTPNTDPHGKLNWECQDCHTPESWSALREPMKFDHDKTGFHLAGMHSAAQCIGCHKSPLFNHVGTACNDCHADHHGGQLGPTCENCHTPQDWQERQNIVQLHAGMGFPLTGVHLIVDCEACHRRHNQQIYAGTPVNCQGCHAEALVSAANPNHQAAGFQSKCELCHDAVSGSWSNASYTHAAAFPLAGAHQKLDCNACHSGGYVATSSTCYDCHATDFNNAADPNHAQNGISHDCVTCHSTTAWVPASFDHSLSVFPLTGKHQTTPCETCHANGYAGTPSTCYGCHQANFAQAKNPDHVQGNISQDCGKCHSADGWSPALFDHSAVGFPLTGMHTTASCAACHVSGYVSTSPACFSCHQTDLAAATDPNHVANNFAQDCSVCHTTAGWSPATFDHSKSPFPLTGAHVTVACATCHTTGYTNTASDCYSCHQNDYQIATDPNHAAQNYDHNCASCHSTANWAGAAFDHSKTVFALTGAHTTLTCAACHATGYINTPTTCYACHQADYQGANSPNHAANSFSQVCSGCHTTTAWLPSTFNHNTTAFPLTGAHISATCIACHSTGYVNTPTTCYACHQADYQGAINPNHATNNFSQVCSGCHTSTAWLPSTFNHSATAFPLTGAHTTLTCIACHSSGYVSTPTACYACHQADYQGAKNPDHAANSFSQVCSGCHTTTAWSPATFNHSTTAFPLTGAHTSLTCVACHSSGYANTPTTCYACHKTNYDGTTNPNHVAANFPTSCQTCHSTSNWTSTTWNHDSQYFRIYSGRHNGQWTLCADCHTNASNYATYECIYCHAHPQAQTNSSHSNVGNYQYLSTACYSCHPRV